MPRVLLMIMALVLGLALGLQYPVSSYQPYPKPIFVTQKDKLWAGMDLTYCWGAVFTNETTGKSHTLHNAYDKNGKPCHP